MDFKTEVKNEVAFLREQMHHVEQKIERINNALAACDDCLEAEGLRRSLHSAELEREVLIGLLEDHLDKKTVSLEALILQRTDKWKNEEARLAQHWHRGRAIPSGYWDAEIKRGALGNLLRRYHAWHAGRPYYAPGRNGRRAQPQDQYIHPWYIVPTRRPKPVATPAYHASKKHRSHDPLEALYEDLVEALDNENIPADHLELIVEPDGQVIVTGYVHSEEQRVEALAAIIMVEDVAELLTDMKIVVPEDCPVCHPELSQQHEHLASDDQP